MIRGAHGTSHWLSHELQRWCGRVLLAAAGKGKLLLTQPSPIPRTSSESGGNPKQGWSEHHVHGTWQAAPHVPLRDWLGPCEFWGPEAKEGLEVLIASLYHRKSFYLDLWRQKNLRMQRIGRVCSKTKVRESRHHSLSMKLCENTWSQFGKLLNLANLNFIVHQIFIMVLL